MSSNTGPSGRRDRGPAPDEIRGQDVPGQSEETGAGPKPETLEAMEAAPLIETWDDLERLTPGEQALVSLPSPLAEAVWIWAAALNDGTPAGRLSRGVRDLLLGMSVSDYRQLVEGAECVMNALQDMAYPRER